MASKFKYIFMYNIRITRINAECAENGLRKHEDEEKSQMNTNDKTCDGKLKYDRISKWFHSKSLTLYRIGPFMPFRIRKSRGTREFRVTEREK